MSKRTQEGPTEAGTDPHPDPLYLRIADAFERSIRNGALTRGQRMPSVREVARQHGVSLSTAVQAYRTLEDQQWISARPRSGYFVRHRPGGPPEPDATRPPTDSLSVGLSPLSQTVLQLAQDPAYHSFGAACPRDELFDADLLRRAMTRAVQRFRNSLASYTINSGHEEYRRAVARRALGLGCQLDPRAIVATNGCLESITLCLRACTSPGDVVALESPTYFGLLEILRNLHLRALEIPTHPRHGISLDALQLALETQPVRAVLVVPTLSNPLGASLSLADRRRLARMVAEHDVPLIEDVIYNDLAEHEDHRRAVKSFDTTGHVMICGSGTKTIAPGIRVGWVEAGRWTQRVMSLKLATSGSLTQVVELTMAELLNRAGIESSARRLRREIGARAAEARRLVAATFPRGTRVTDPPGGFILWVEMPVGVDSARLFERCLAEHIVIAPGTMFSASDRYRHCIRLGVGSRWDDGHRRALMRVGAIACELAADDAPRAIDQAEGLVPG